MQINKTDICDKEMYDFYKSNVKEPLAYKEYKRVIKSYNNKIIDHVLQGKTYYFGESLSAIKIVERKRRLRLDKNGNPILPVNWGETRNLNLRDDNGNLIKVYITDQPYYYIVKWYNYLKKDLMYYKFKPCKEFKIRLFKHLTEDPFAANKFKQLQ